MFEGNIRTKLVRREGVTTTGPRETTPVSDDAELRLELKAKDMKKFGKAPFPLSPSCVRAKKRKAGRLIMETEVRSRP